MQLYVSGSLAFDRIMVFPGKFADHILPDKLHILNVCFLVNGIEEKFGGTAGNIAYNLALLEEKPLVVAAVGRDFHAYERRFASLGLPLDGCRIVEEELTASAHIVTDETSNQITAFNPGAMKASSQFTFAKPAGEALAIHAPGNVDDMVNYSKACREQGIRYIFDPGQQITALSGEQMTEAITGSYMLTTNDYELEMVMKATGLTQAEILERTEILVTTLGGEGSRITTKDEVITVPVSPVSEVVDPTGAGDAYRAGLVKGLALGKDLETAGKMGATCASFCVEASGTQAQSFTPDEFWARYEKVFGPA